MVLADVRDRPVPPQSAVPAPQLLPLVHGSPLFSEFDDTNLVTERGPSRAKRFPGAGRAVILEWEETVHQINSADLSTPPRADGGRPDPNAAAAFKAPRPQPGPVPPQITIAPLQPVKPPAIGTITPLNRD